ncbi:MAG TPA: YfdX family protein [Allosphingosinicella sp.]|nr:YfdX family protein [Allosphingosinicella sp.]
MQNIAHNVMPYGRFPAHLRMALLACGATLMLPACSSPGNEVEGEGNRAPPAAAAPVQPGDSSLSRQVAEKRRRLVADAVTALRETQRAFDLLAADRPDDAVAALERATGKLDLVLAADPGLALAAVDVRVVVHDVLAEPEAVMVVRTQATDALALGRVQVARQLLADLASEQVISVTSLPLATYPAAIRQAGALIHGGRAAEAAAVLQTALATLVVEDTIIPLPLVRAEALIDQARALAGKAHRTPEENGRLQRMIAGTRSQLQLAQALGYATREDLDGLLDQLRQIEQATQGQATAGGGLFDRIKALFTTARGHADARPAGQGEGSNPVH